MYMSSSKKSVLTFFAIIMSCASLMVAQDIHLRLPKRSQSTPVQSLNRGGVDALNHHDYAKAKKLFYKAYLLDPNDPFTLNNLGYIAELEGQVDRAQHFYDLSEAMNSDAMVEKTTDPKLKGKQVTLVAGHADSGVMQVNKLNSEAIGFLTKDRPFEAQKYLDDALKIDPKNPFTLNNLGYDMEQQGELQKAVTYYRDSAEQHSSQAVIVAVHKSWRGKPISEIASANADRVAKAYGGYESHPEQQVALLNLRGVAALNRNDPQAAREYFDAAFKKDPHNAFALNNMGYIAEMQGDRETAQTYYDQAKSAPGSERRVAVASRANAEGKRLTQDASANGDLVQASLLASANMRRMNSRGVGGVELENRGFSKTPPPSENNVQPASSNTLPTEGPTTANPQPANGNAAQPASVEPPANGANGANATAAPSVQGNTSPNGAASTPAPVPTQNNPQTPTGVAPTTNGSQQPAAAPQQAPNQQAPPRAVDQDPVPYPRD